MVALLALGISAGAQINQHSNYIGLNLGGGMNTLLYSPADGSRGLGWGYMGELKYIHFFGRHIGLGLGANFNMSHASTTYDFTEVTTGLTHPSNGLAYDEHNVFNSWKERQRLATLNVPIELFYRNKISERWSYMIGLGAELNFPMFGNYSAEDGSYEIQGVFPAYGSYPVRNLPDYGFRTYDADVDADIEMSKMGVSLIGELSFNYALSNHWGLNFGVYAGYGITDMLDELSTDPIVKINDADVNQIDYAGTLSSNQIDKLHLLNVGVKLGVNLGWSCKHGEKAAAAAAAAGAGAAAVASYDDKKSDDKKIDDKKAAGKQDTENAADQPAATQQDQPQLHAPVFNQGFGNDAADDEAEAAAQEARCNARRMNDADLAQARSDFQNDLAEAERLASQCGSSDAKNYAADARAKAADAERAYANGKYCRAYDLYLDAYGDIANSYAADANDYASKNSDARPAADDADLYAEAAHRDGLDCAIAASRNAKLKAEIARDGEGSHGAGSSASDPAYAQKFASDALAMAQAAGSKPAQTDAKDAEGKAYRGNLADAYAAAAKSYAESADAFAKKCGKPEHAAAAKEAQQYAAEAAEAARRGDNEAAYAAALKAREAARRAAACEMPAASNGDVQSILAPINASVYFDFNTTNPTVDNKTNIALRALSRLMADNKGVKVTVTGHTDNVGSAEGNQALGLRRAEAVKNLMVNMGAPAANISTDSKGQTQPAASNDTDEGRRQNRRAVISVR